MAVLFVEHPDSGDTDVSANLRKPDLLFELFAGVFGVFLCCVVDADRFDHKIAVLIVKVFLIQEVQRTLIISLANIEFQPAVSIAIGFVSASIACPATRSVNKSSGYCYTRFLNDESFRIVDVLP